MNLPPEDTCPGYQRTCQAVRCQIKAMAQPDYEIGIYDRHQGMTLRTWKRDQILASISWLRYRNAKGADIFIRPISSVGLVLLDDLDHQMILRLRHDGLQPAVVTETSPGNFQCWIRLLYNHQRKEISSKLVTRLLRYLASEYGTDPRSADWKHFGRLAGFTNQKARHASRAGQPYVLLRFARHLVAKRGRELLLQVKRSVVQTRVTKLTSIPKKSDTYAQRMKRILAINRQQPWVNSPDYTRLDFMIAREMLCEGYAYEVVEQALLLGSPLLSERKAGHVKDYVRRTVLAATGQKPFSSPNQASLFSTDQQAPEPTT